MPPLFKTCGEVGSFEYSEKAAKNWKAATTTQVRCPYRIAKTETKLPQRLFGNTWPRLSADESRPDAVAALVEPLAADDFNLLQASVHQYDSQSLLGIENLTVQQGDSTSSDVDDVRANQARSRGRPGSDC